MATFINVTIGFIVLILALMLGAQFFVGMEERITKNVKAQVICELKGACEDK